MKRYDLGETDLAQYTSLTEQEKMAWLHPEPHSYHSYHVERMGENTFRWRDSREAKFYIGTAEELTVALLELKLRKFDPKFEEASKSAQILRLLTQQEVDDLLGDL